MLFALTETLQQSILQIKSTLYLLTIMMSAKEEEQGSTLVECKSVIVTMHQYSDRRSAFSIL
jgi:hypothetical protein